MTPKIVASKLELIKSHDNTDYEYLLAVSSDSLYVLSKDKRIIETIVKRVDNKGYICSAASEDDFLEAIHVIKMDILANRNPLRIIFRKSL